MNNDPSAALRNPEIRALLASRFFGVLPMSAAAIVIGYQVYEISRDPLSLGILGLAEAIPALVLMLLGGHLADRAVRQRILVIGELVFALCALGLMALSWGTDAATKLIGIYLVSFVTGVASGFTRPAFTAIEAEVIPAAQYARVAGMLSSASQVGSLLGPALGGIAYEALGVSNTYLLIALLLLASVGCLMLIAPRPAPVPEVHESLRESLSAGVRFVLNNQVLIGSMALDLFAVLFGGVIALLPVYASDILKVGPVGLGVLRTAPSIGALAVMLWTTRRPPRRDSGALLLWSVAAFGVTMIVFGVSQNFWLSLVALFLSGVADGVSMVVRIIILRVMSPEAMRGRIASVNWVFIGASNEVGAFESGLAAKLLGTVPSVVAGGVVTLLVVAGVAATAPKLRLLQLSDHE